MSVDFPAPFSPTMPSVEDFGTLKLTFFSTRTPKKAFSIPRNSSIGVMRRPSTDVVAGTELSGMSTRVVAPPAAAARVAVEKPSHSVRPGSFMWTCVSTSPGSTGISPASKTGQLSIWW